MGTLRRFFRSTFCFLLVSSSFPLAAHSDGPAWVEVKSPHFSVVTDAGEKRGREVAMRFEQMRAVFALLMAKANVNLAVPLQIVAFRNTKEMREVAPLWHGKPTELAGLFQGGHDRSFIMLDMSVSDPWKTVFHEYAHQLLSSNMNTQLAPWFEEGFAEYFSSIEVDGKQARVGKVPEYYYYVLRQNAPMKMPDLFKVRQYSQTYNETGDHRTIFYAQSGMLVHYLYDKQLLPKATAYFNLTIARKVPVEDAIQQAFGMSPQQFDKALDNYIHSGQFSYYVLPTPPEIANLTYSTAPVTLAESKAIVADIHLHSPDYHEKAAAEFEEVLQMEPTNARACRSLGYINMQKGRNQEAAAYFRRSTQSDPKDPGAHYYTAMLMSQDRGFSDPDKLAEMTRELETTIALDPAFADAYMMLGNAQIYAGEVDQGLATVEKALQLNPRNEIYRFNLAQMYLSNRQTQKALGLLHELEGTSNAMLASQVKSSIKQAEAFDRGPGGTKDDDDDSGEVSVGFNSSTEKSKDDRPIVTRERRTGSNPAATSPGAVPSRSASEPEAPPAKPTPIAFVRGVLKAVDCTQPPAAVLTVVSASKTWKMRMPDTEHTVLLGATKFSCAWTARKVSVNYRSSGQNEGTVVSLELE